MATAKENRERIINEVKTQAQAIIAKAQGFMFGHCFLWAVVRTSPKRAYRVCLGGACLNEEEFRTVPEAIGNIKGVERVWYNID